MNNVTEVINDWVRYERHYCMSAELLYSYQTSGKLSSRQPILFRLKDTVGGRLPSILLDLLSPLRKVTVCHQDV